MKTILSLFDYSGEWAKPYILNDYHVIRIDIKDGLDIFDFKYKNIKEVYGILAAIPCTDFALTGAASFAAKDKNGQTAKSIKLVKKTMQIINYFNPSFWVIENPMTRMHKLVPEIGAIKMRFSPNEFAGWSKNPTLNQYSKQTWLFGKFAIPNKKEMPSLITGLKWKDSKTGNREKRSELRSITPDGFANSFFKSNR